jgi:hypothetical protein
MRATRIGIEDPCDVHAVRAIGERVEEPGDTGAGDDGSRGSHPRTMTRAADDAH